MASPPAPRLPASAAYALSAALHVVAFLLLLRVDAHRPSRGDAVAVEIVEVAPPPPREEPPPPAPTPAARPVVKTPLAPPREAPKPPPRPVEAPPPPNEPPPPDAGPVAKAPVRIGLSMSSSTAGGGVAAPVGNTLYGELPKSAPEPSEVKPYRSDRYVAPTQVTVLPRPIGECALPASEYPEAALRLGIEGVVVLVLTVNEVGDIADGRVVEDPGHGLGPAALSSVRRHCRFAAGERGGEKVATSFRYKVRFELP